MRAVAGRTETRRGDRAVSGRRGDRRRATGLKVGAIGAVAVLSMALASSAPITAMTGNVPIATGFGTGVHTPGAFLLAMVVLVVFTVGYAAMSRHVTATGSFYGYISHGLGRTAGMASGLLGTVAYVVFEGSLIGIFSSFTRSTIVAFGGPAITWVWIALMGIAAIAVMGYLGIELSGRVLGSFLIAEVVILLVVGFAVLVQGGGPAGLVPGALDPLHALAPVPSDLRAGIVGSAGIGVFFCFWSWVGFETVAVYGEESRQPKTMVPRTLFVAVIGIGVLYVFVSWMSIAGNGPSQAIDLARSSDPFAMFFDVTRTFVGAWAEDLYRVLIITGSFACALAFHNTAARYIFALGREAPTARGRRALGATHHRHRSPHVASVVQSAVTLLLILLFFWFQRPSATAPDVAYDDVYGLLAILGTMIILICQSLVSLSVISYFHILGHHRETANLFRTLLAPLVGAVGMIYVVYLLFQNLSFAAGGAASSPFFAAIPWVVLAVGALGVAYALVVRWRRPDLYAQLGRTVLSEVPDGG